MMGISPSPIWLMKPVRANCLLSTTSPVFSVCFMRLKKQRQKKNVTHAPEGEKYSGEQRNFTIKASAISQMQIYCGARNILEPLLDTLTFAQSY